MKCSYWLSWQGAVNCVRNWQWFSFNTELSLGIHLEGICLWSVSGSWERRMGTVAAQEDGWGTGGCWGIPLLGWAPELWSGQSLALEAPTEALRPEFPFWPNILLALLVMGDNALCFLLGKGCPDIVKLVWELSAKGKTYCANWDDWCL